jgi:ribosomal-protein-alanine N-acetyltransferase
LLPTHAPVLFTVLQDPALYAFLDDSAPASLAALRERYARLASRRSADGTQRWLNWAICEDEQPPFGYVKATVLADGRAWVAYVLARACWGRGLATRATATMIDYLEHALGVTQCLASVDAGNAKSIALLRRLAFREAGESEAAAAGISAGDRLFVREAR